MAFHAFRESLDPDGDQKEYTFRWRLNTGESIATAVVDFVDPDSFAIVTADMTKLSVTFGLLAGTVWGVTVWLKGPAADAAYYLRCRVTTNSTPIPRKADHTMRLNVAQH